MTLKTDNIIYYTPTQKTFILLMFELEELGCKWKSGKLPTHEIDIYTVCKIEEGEGGVCVYVNDKILSYQSKEYFANRYPDTEIVEYRVEYRTSKESAAVDYANEVLERQKKKGQERYAATIEESGYTILQCIENTLEELADAMVYLSKARNDLIKEKDKKYKIPLHNLKTEDGEQQYLSKKGGKYFACRLNSQIKQVFTENELKHQIPSFYRQFAVAVEEQ